MIDLEDLPRLESLSPLRDIEDDYPPGMTIIPTTNMNETLNNGNLNMTAIANNISCKTNDNLISNSGCLMTTGNDSTDRMLIENGGAGLRFISQLSAIINIS
ncbi:uncharacterized protein LOC119599901 isoform X2 [Lucilia sericata]|uniref:uncharacterized protein LOC119599901 isoform X2 n=1 Tax=Lucilia sericata TaxID=13632 RepID=UPI0018A80F95|nr:uncharacterized protein LOC119599901 isoform X2 [Lucilia sericata]